MASQESNWDELRRMTEQIQMLTTLVGQVDNEELKELRRVRDRSKVLEGEHSALQRRMKEYENKAANHEKIVQASRQSLLQARQRAEEWEKRAKDAENKIETMQTKLDEVEQNHSQLDADFALMRLQLDERDSEERVDKVCPCYPITCGTSNSLVGSPEQTARSNCRSRGSSHPPASRGRQGEEAKRGLAATACRSLPERQDAPSAAPRFACKHYLRPQPCRHSQGSAQRYDERRPRRDSSAAFRPGLYPRPVETTSSYPDLHPQEQIYH